MRATIALLLAGAVPDHFPPTISRRRAGRLIAMHWGATAVPPELEGASFVPLLQNGSPPGKQRVFSQYPHSLTRGASQHGFANASGPVMGYTMRTAGARSFADAAAAAASASAATA